MNFAFFAGLRSFFWVVGISPFIVIFALRFFRGWAASLRARGWPQTVGRVLSSGVQIHSHSSGRGGRIHSPYPYVVYRYQVNGQEFQNKRMHFGNVIGGLGATRSAARYPAGMTVPVFYNPQNPNEAVLEKRAAGNWINLLILAVLLLLLLSVV